jgi:serine/threonine protein kinase
VLVDVSQLKQQFLTEFTTYANGLRVPLFVVALFFFCSKLISIWLLLICSVFAAQALFPHLPLHLREKYVIRLRDWSLNHAKEWEFLKDLNDGLRFMKPFLFAAIVFAAAPITVCIMAGHYIAKTCKPNVRSKARKLESGVVLLKQNVSQNQDDETSFYHSPAFAITTLAVVGLGIPVAIMLFIYCASGIEERLTAVNSGVYVQYPESEQPLHSHGHTRSFAGERFHLNTADLPAVGRYLPEPTAPSLQHFAIYAYLVSLASALSVIFIRAYFLFPLNFASNEYEIRVDRNGVKRGHVEGWFSELIWYCWPEFMPRNFSWSEIKRVEYIQGGSGRLSPLPATIFAKRSIVYQVLNRLASVTDSFVDRIGRTEYISFDHNADLSSWASRINIRLWELNSDDRVRLFYAMRTYAPDLVIPPLVQEKLIGSSVMKEPKYTDLWFNMLTAEQALRADSLVPGDTLGGGAYTIVEKLGSGGQAAAFTAKNVDGDLVVLKEFILNSAETFGALVESATEFENESSILSRLDHPRVVKFKDIFAQDRRAYIVMEFVEGSTLRQIVDKFGPVSERTALELALEMCDVLSYLHNQAPPVVHRDFTPENMIRQNVGGLKVVDFSVASRTGPARSGDCVGKHSYTPPEQFRSQASTQSDIYALGATLFFILTGKDPKPISESDPRSVKPETSDILARIVLKATALELTDRYESVDWLRLDLEYALQTFHSESCVSIVKDAHAIEAAHSNASQYERSGMVIKLGSGRKKLKVPTKRSKTRAQAGSGNFGKAVRFGKSRRTNCR